MKKVIISLIIVMLALSLFAGLAAPVISESEDGSSEARGARWSSYTGYYNKTFNMAKSWNPDNVSIVAFVQTEDQTSKSADSQGSSGNFDSSEVMQSTIDFLDGSKKSTGTSRNVLGELFTATWCQFCPGGVGAFDRITRDSTYFPTKTTMIEFHASGDHGNQAGVTRSSRYNFGGIPTAIFDGFDSFIGGNRDPNSSVPESHYKRIINARAPKQSIVDITTFGQKTSSNGWINVTVELLNPTPIRNLKVQIMVVEDIYPANNTGAFYRYTVQEILTPVDFIPTNHAPKIKQQLQPLIFSEDGVDETSIQLVPSYEDEDLDVLTYSSDREGDNKQNIKVEIDETGNVTLTPDANWNGEEDITFYCNDSIADPVGQTIKVTIQNVNDPPIVANHMTDFTMYEDLPIENQFNLSSVFFDIDMNPDLNVNPQEPLVITFAGDSNIEVTIENNWVSFDPKPDWNGDETITFTATDSESAYVTDNVKIKVTSENDPPELLSTIPDVTLNEDEKLTNIIDLNEYFSDQDGDSLTFDFDEPDNMKIKLSYLQDSVYVSIIPDDNYWGTETITFEAIDIPGTTPVTADMKVIINSVNDIPILNITDDWNIVTSGLIYTEDEITIFEDTPVEMYVTAYDTADNDKLTFSDDTALFDIDPATGEIKFTPTYEEIGEYDITIAVDDGLLNGKVEQEITFKVENVNDPPGTAEIIDPVDGKTYITDTPIDFEGKCDDEDLLNKNTNELLSYEWSADDGSTDEVLSLESEFSTTLEPGTYEITLLVEDKAGEKSSTMIEIIVDIDRSKDTDSDGVPDFEDEDDDNDGIPDTWENAYSLDPEDPLDADEDADKDGFSNLEEYYGDDGVPGGDDSTNPTKKTQVPDRKTDSTGDSGSTSTSGISSSLALIIIVVIIIVVVLILLMFTQKRKKSQSEQAVPQPQEPQPQPELVNSEMMPPPTQQMQIPPGYYGPPPQQQQQPMQMPMQMGAAAPEYPYPYPPEPQGQGQPPAIDGAMTMPTQEPNTFTTEHAEMGSATSETSELPATGMETPLLPSPPTTITESGEAGVEDSKDQESKTEANPADANVLTCPSCGTIVKEGWALCPNCKEML